MKLSAVLTLILSSSVLFAQSIDEIEPEEVGLSGEQLGRVESRLQEGVDNGDIPGAVALVARNGHIAYLEAVGELDEIQGTGMTTDAIFRMASMTKPVITVAA